MDKAEALDTAVTHLPGTYENHGKAFPVPVFIKVSQYTLASIILDAIEAGHHGIMYWCPKLRIGEVAVPEGAHEHYHEYLGRNLANDGTVVFHVPDADTVPDYSLDNVKQKGVKMFTLTRGMLLKGIGMALLKGHIEVGGTEPDGSVDFDLDGPACDVILQFSLFDKIIYG